MTRAERVCAVVVTYNRSALLRECLDAVLGQTHPVDVLVIDNASTDETPSVLEEYADRVRVVRATTNTGGAGGFASGLLLAVDSTDADWFWLMDDDTIARPDCVERLLEAGARLPEAPAVLASRVEWTDGRRHPMNAGMLDDRFDPAEQAAAAGGIALRAASFVSVLLRRDAVVEHGLPMADYFIWVDDVEYTMRLTRDSVGVLVPSSVAVHKTDYFELSGLTPRYYYHVRNWLWLLRFSPGLAHERPRLVVRHLRGVASSLSRRQSRAVVAAAVRGLRDGLVTRPDLSALEPLRDGQRLAGGPTPAAVGRAQ